MFNVCGFLKHFNLKIFFKEWMCLQMGFEKSIRLMKYTTTSEYGVCNE